MLTHNPQPEQLALLTDADHGADGHLVFGEQAADFDRRGAGLGHGVGDVFGSLAAPARNTPAVKVSTGWSLGWASWKKPSLSIAEADFLGRWLHSRRLGTMAVARTTRSAMISTGLPISESSPLTMSLSPSG